MTFLESVLEFPEFNGVNATSFVGNVKRLLDGDDMGILVRDEIVSVCRELEEF